MQEKLTPRDSLAAGKLLLQSLAHLARAAAEVATFCDHYEHNESGEPESVIRAGALFRQVAAETAAVFGVDLLDSYSGRLQAIERGNVHYPGDSDPDKARGARSLRELQGIQTAHDRHYHPDVFGMSKYDQLRHYSFHLTKIVGATAEACNDEATWADFKRRRLPDMFLFGIKLATVMGRKLSDEPITPVVGGDGNAVNLRPTLL